MLALAISALFTLTGILAVLVIADSLIKARVAYAQLMQEAVMLADGFAMQPAAAVARLRPTQRRITADRRSALPRTPLAFPACAAA